MATRGRKPKPPELKILEGGRRDRLNGAAPTPADGVGPPPGHLADDARAEWERIAPLLSASGVLKSTDSAALSLYCSHYARWLEAERAIEAHGILSETAAGNPKANPAVSIAREEMSAMMRILAEFGCTPSSRSRVRADQTGPVDGLEEFLSA